MSKKQMTVEQFLKDVANHKMTVKLDHGLYRHVSFKQASNSWSMWFELVTWPDGLTITGDMGTWAFSRVEDMFTFFRSDKLQINASYWCEKIISESRFGGPAEKFDMDTYKENVLSNLYDDELDAQLQRKIIEALEDEVFRNDSDESTARRDLADFEHGAFQFSDSWEITGKAYTYHFLWCLYAIVWGIQQWDAARAVEASPASIAPAGLVDAG